MSFIYFKDQQISKTSFYQQFKDDIFLENHETSQLPRLIGGRLGQSEPGFTLQSRGRERRRSAVSAAHQCQLQQFRKTTKIHSKTFTTPKVILFLFNYPMGSFLFVLLLRVKKTVPRRNSTKFFTILIIIINKNHFWALTQKSYIIIVF